MFLASELRAPRGLVFLPLRGPVDALRLRRLRNAVRGWMTRDTSQIGVLRQLRWWARDYRVRQRAGSFQAWLVWTGRRPVGYGVVRWDRGRWWVTGALLPPLRGVGLGRELFAFLTEEAAARDRATRGRGEVWLEVRGDNEPARRLYERLGYQYAEEGGDVFPTLGRPVHIPPLVLVMVRRQEPSGPPSNPGGDG